MEDIWLISLRQIETWIVGAARNQRERITPHGAATLMLVNVFIVKVTPLQKRSPRV